MIRIVEILGYATIMVLIPMAVLNVPRPGYVYWLLASVWLVFGAGVLAVATDWTSELSIRDAFRLASVSCGFIYLVQVSRHRRIFQQGGQRGHRR